ncbi:MAG: hypothetical protein EBR95_04380 [Verrucomicrobia bacterium]|nr:hypothetical protein [Verrucomicrobiota bacterium]
MNLPRPASSVRPGFSLVEVTLAIGIVGVALLSLVGILGSTFQQVDDIMQTNRALSGATRLVAALDSPRTIIYHQAADLSGLASSTLYLQQGRTTLDPEPNDQPASNFDIAYRLLSQAKNTDTAVWLYVYERKVVTATSDFSGTTYNLSSNPSVIEVASADGNGNNFTAVGASFRNVVGTPMRVRLTVSKLLNGQRVRINANGEPDPTPFVPGVSDLPPLPSDYALAYLPVVAEFFPHDYTDFNDFRTRGDKPLLVQNIVISR